MLLIPVKSEVKWWLLATLRHVCHVEYYLHKLGLNNPDDMERPHDLVGPGNKFEWGVIRGCALQARDPQPDFETHILPSIELHRIQYHHRRWNEPHRDKPDQPSVGATPDDMRVGAVDTICSLLEPREYQGGMHSFEGAKEVCERNPPHKVPWLLEMLPLMQVIDHPNLSVITHQELPDIGIPEEIHARITERVVETYSYLFGERCKFE